MKNSPTDFFLARPFCIFSKVVRVISPCAFDIHRCIQYSHTRLMKDLFFSFRLTVFQPLIGDALLLHSILLHTQYVHVRQCNWDDWCSTSCWQQSLIFSTSSLLILANHQSWPIVCELESRCQGRLTTLDILCAGATFKQEDLGVKLGPYVLMQNGQPLEFDAKAASLYLKETCAVHGTVEVEVDIGSGTASGVAWGCDLSYDYVKINAEYSTWVSRQAHSERIVRNTQRQHDSTKSWLYCVQKCMTHRGHWFSHINQRSNWIRRTRYQSDKVKMCYNEAV